MYTVISGICPLIGTYSAQHGPVGNDKGSTGVRGINEILTEPNEMQNNSKVGGTLTVYIS